MKGKLEAAAVATICFYIGSVLMSHAPIRSDTWINSDRQPIPIQYRYRYNSTFGAILGLKRPRTALILNGPPGTCPVRQMASPPLDTTDAINRFGGSEALNFVYFTDGKIKFKGPHWPRAPVHVNTWHKL